MFCYLEENIARNPTIFELDRRSPNASAHCEVSFVWSSSTVIFGQLMCDMTIRPDTITIRMDPAIELELEFGLLDPVRVYLHITKMFSNGIRITSKKHAAQPRRRVEVAPIGIMIQNCRSSTLRHKAFTS